MKFISLFFLIAAIAGQAFSLSLEEALGSARAAELVNQGTLTEVQTRKGQPALVPEHAYTREIIRAAISDLNPGIIVESLFLYTKPAGASTETWTEAERTALYNEVLALSTLAGLQYFSTSRNTMRTFYETSVIVDGPETKNPRPDPVFAAPLAELTLYARQKDLTFGENLYRYVYYARPDALIFTQENLSDMYNGIIKAVGRNRLRTTVAFLDVGDCLLIYTASLVKAASIPALARRIGASFSTRAEAILGWFSGRADRAFGKPQ
jgi:hypothetical protein